MNLSVKNELKLLHSSVRFAVTSCPENALDIELNKERASSVSISLSGSIYIGRSFDLAGMVCSGTVYTAKPAMRNFYRIIEPLAAKFITVINALVRRQVRAVEGGINLAKALFSRKILFRRQAVLACAGGLRL